MFELRADKEGPRSVSITAWLGGRYLGELLIEITADRDRASGQHREFRAEIDAEPSEGAVSLVVRYDPELQAYRFEFRDEDNPNEVVSRLSFEPRRCRIERLVADLDRLAAGRGGYSADQVRDYLVTGPRTSPMPSLTASDAVISRSIIVSLPSRVAQCCPVTAS